MTGVTLEKVVKRFGDVQVIHGVDLTVDDGEFCVFVGPSGCGKSTLLRMIAGLEETSSGAIRIGARDVTYIDPSERGVAMVFQTYALYPHMTVAENMGFGLKMTGHPKAEIDRKVAEAARILKLEPLLDRKPKALSGGQRQRVAIARVLLKDAPILILDEATSALDSEIEAAIQESLYSLMEGKSVIAVAHRLSTIAAMDRLVVMDKGRIVEEGSHDELLRKGGLYADLWRRQSGGFLAREAAE